jgi:hypothetical protein
MERIDDKEDLIKRYLLGELSEAEQTAIEDEYFSDPSKYDRFCKVEDQLLDAAARGSLSETDRERFEQSYLTNPMRWRHVMFSRALARVVDENLAARRAVSQTAGRERIERLDEGLPWMSHLARLLRRPRFALGIAAALLIGLGGTWLVIETSRLRARLAEALREGETERLRAQTQSQRLADLESQYGQLAEERKRLQAQLQTAIEISQPTSHPAAVFFAIPLRAFRNSGGQEGLRPLIIPHGSEEARLRINLPDHEFPAYQLTLLTTDGKEVFAVKDLRPQAASKGTVLTVSVPTRNLASGDNVIRLSGITASGEVDTLGKVIIKVSRR